MNSLFQIRDNCMTIRVPEELDHHNALPIQQEADEVMMNRDIQTIVFDFRDTGIKRERTNRKNPSNVGYQ